MLQCACFTVKVKHFLSLSKYGTGDITDFLTVFQLDHQLSHASLDMDVSINFKLIKLGHDFCNVMLPEKNAILTHVKV